MTSTGINGVESGCSSGTGQATRNRPKQTVISFVEFT